MNKRVLIIYIKIAWIIICLWVMLYFILRLNNTVNTRTKRHECRGQNTIQTQQIKNNNSKLPEEDLDKLRKLIKEKDLLCLDA
jgi:hypothetical protein